MQQGIFVVKKPHFFVNGFFVLYFCPSVFRETKIHDSTDQHLSHEKTIWTDTTKGSLTLKTEGLGLAAPTSFQ
jgi:hypothetical protein